jgi:hypothetical protein
MEQLLDGRMLCRAVGVSFDGRQAAVRKLRPGQELVLLKHSGNGFDAYGIGIFDPADRNSPLGFIGRDTKHHRVFDAVRLESGMPTNVHQSGQEPPRAVGLYGGDRGLCDDRWRGL